MKVKFKLEDIKAKAKFRPAGYYEDVLSQGQLTADGQEVEFDRETAHALIIKYGKTNPIIQYKRDRGKWGPILWKILHERPFVEKMVLEEELDWLKEFTNWIPCGECSVHWKQFVRNNQPDLSSVKAYFDWTVKAHNDVNKKLGKPIWQE